MSMTITTGDDRDDDVDDQVIDRDDDRDEDEPRDRRGKQRDDDADDSGNDDDGDDDKSPEELKAEIRRLRSSLSKANSSGNRRRQQLRELRGKVAALDDAEDEDNDDDEGEVAPKPRQRQGVDQRSVDRAVSKAVKRRERELEEQNRRDVIDMRAEAALTRAGVSDKNIRLLKRELDYDELDFDAKTRTVDGLDEEVDRLRSDFPDLFRRGKVSGRRINGGDDREAGKRPRVMSASERQAAQLRGRG